MSYRTVLLRSQSGIRAAVAAAAAAVVEAVEAVEEAAAAVEAVAKYRQLAERDKDRAQESRKSEESNLLGSRAHLKLPPAQAASQCHPTDCRTG